MRLSWLLALPRKLLVATWPLLIALLWCEYLIYFVFFSTWCSWPSDSTLTGSAPLRTLVFADPHLLGNQRGHPFDKLRREWQMHRSFQTAVSLFSPELVIVLGDLFDEGYIASPKEFKQYANRFHELFYVPLSTHFIAVVGNHDIGFHDRMLAFDPHLRGRFERFFGADLAQLFTIKNITFLSVNSMSLEGCGCHLCTRTRTLVEQLARKHDANCANSTDVPCSRPVLLTHFPLYRLSDDACTGDDAADDEERHLVFKENIDCLSREATRFVLDTVRPRVAFTGHTHNGCTRMHENGVFDWTVASFSWRNRANPTFLLTKFTTDDYSISKCFVPNENSVINTYMAAVIVFFINLYVQYDYKLKRS